MPPQFPDFKPIELSDKALVIPFLKSFQPETSELTFTNLFIWRNAYRWEWSVSGEHLIIRTDKEYRSIHKNGGRFFLPPIGPFPRGRVAEAALRRHERETGEPGVIERADKRLVREFEQDGALSGLFVVEPMREHFDYLYTTSDLIELSGRKYHAKRNFINRFIAEQEFVYLPLGRDLLSGCRAFSDYWCRIRRCEDDLGLMGEWGAVNEILDNFDTLDVVGGAVLIENKVEAFAIGESLRDDIAVVHIEKANPNIRGLYPVINQKFIENAFPQVPFVNREQDLGEEGLRRAKESYYPVRLVEKFRVRLAR